MQLRLSQMSTHTRKVLWALQQGAGKAMTPEEIARVSNLPLPMVSRTLYQQRNKNLPSVREVHEDGVKKYQFAHGLIELIDDVGETGLASPLTRVPHTVDESGNAAETSSQKRPPVQEPPVEKKAPADQDAARNTPTSQLLKSKEPTTSFSYEKTLSALSKPMSAVQLSEVLKQPVNEVISLLNELNQRQLVKIEKVFGSPVYTRLPKHLSHEETSETTHANQEQTQTFVLPQTDMTVNPDVGQLSEAIKLRNAVKKIRLSLLSFAEAIQEIEELLEQNERQS